jgi:hypothetical protein
MSQDHPPQGPLTGRDLARDFADEFLSFDRGLLYTWRAMLLRPGPTVRTYVETRDPRLTKPLRFFVINTAVLTAVMLLLRPLLDAAMALASEHQRRVGAFVLEHTLFINAAGLPLAALALWLLLRRRGERFVACLVQATYVQAMVMLFNAVTALIVVPLQVKGPATLALGFAAITGVAIALWTLWAWAGFIGGSRLRAFGLALIAQLAQAAAAGGLVAALRAAGVW